MLFTTPLFLFFFAAVWLGHLLIGRMSGDSGKARRGFLLLASLVFYASWEFPTGLWFVPLLVASSCWDWWAGREMYRLPRGERGKRNALLLLSLSLNLGSLAIFKYLGFFATTINDLAAAFGAEWRTAVPRLILPLGISFFTFQSMSYTIDAWRRRGRPYRSLWDFLFFVTFFPQLIAGPVVRANQFRDEIRAGRDYGVAALVEGLRIMTVGYVLKVVLADNVAVRVDRLFESLDALTPFDAWVACLGFGLQIYCDFAGYSLIAIGLARVFGYRLPRNFDVPYLAVGLRDFWRRWHITLSTWLRDYLYIPLGGSRQGVAKTAAALALTMLLGGLWHGASWNFVLWGAGHGLLLAMGRVMRAALPGVARWQESAHVGRAMTWVLTVAAVFVLWVPFRAPDFAATLQVLDLLAQAPGALGAALSGGDGRAVGAWLHHESLLVLPFLALFVGYHLWVVMARRFTPSWLREGGDRESAGSIGGGDSGPVGRGVPSGALIRGRVLPEDWLASLRPVPAGLLMGGAWVVIELFHVGEVSFIYFAF